MSIVWHRHHIVPRHMGGGDEPSNLVKVNVAMHAFLHKCLWEEHGFIEDFIAWKCLSGQITNAEANALAWEEGRKRGRDKTNREGKGGWATLPLEKRRENGSKNMHTLLKEGRHSSQIGTGIFSPEFTPEMRSNASRAGTISQFAKGVHSSQVGSGIFEPGMNWPSKAGKIGGRSAVNQKKGVHGFSKEQKIENARKGAIAANISSLSKGTHASQVGSGIFTPGAQWSSKAGKIGGKITGQKIKENPPVCPHCGRVGKSIGIYMHIKACAKRNRTME